MARPATEYDLEEAADLYQGGMPLADLAYRLSVWRPRLRGELVAFGVLIRRRGRPEKRHDMPDSLRRIELPSY